MKVSADNLGATDLIFGVLYLLIQDVLSEKLDIPRLNELFEVEIGFFQLTKEKEVDCDVGNVENQNRRREYTSNGWIDIAQ